MTKRSPRIGSVAALRHLYNFLNKDYFESKCPKRLPIEWADLPSTIIARVKWTKRDGKDYKPRVMQFDRKLKPRYLQKQVGMSMVHEMCHLLCGVTVDCREWDGRFDKMMFKLCKRGAFRRFW